MCRPEPVILSGHIGLALACRREGTSGGGRVSPDLPGLVVRFETCGRSWNVRKSASPGSHGGQAGLERPIATIHNRAECPFLDD